jgi:hypothetical protein
MNRQQLLKRLETAWAALNESYAGLSDSQLTEPGVVGDWSAKDVLAHVTIWEEEALKYLPGILQGIQPPRYSAMYGGIDAFNARTVQERQSLSPGEVRRQLDAAHRRLMALVKSVPEDEIATETRFRRRLRLDTYSHYREHTEAIRDWRERRAAR